MRSRLQQLLSGGGMDGASLGKAYKQQFGGAIVPEEYGAGSLRQLLLLHGTAIPRRAHKVGRTSIA